ncbi:Eukaryotic translation initiation factor 4B [Ascochyta clinopodiicola]|nr:Eukaryotic translation initiation factor 4B [Ascochyta clinopodiicola]
MAPKNKAAKMSLGDFLGDQTLGSWADEMEDMPMPRAGGGGGASYGGGSDRPTFGSGGGFGADRVGSFADRGFATREELPLPSKPPYTAHLGNLSFDATEGDVNDFFSACEVTNVRIVEDKLDRKPKGFGYVEFGSLEGLKKALDLSGSQFQGRNVRVSVAEPPKDRPEARDISDWSRKGPLPDLPGQRRGPDRGYSSRGFDAASDAGSDRGERRRPAFESDGKQRDFGNWERKGPLSPSAEAPREGGRRFDGPREPRPEREGGFRERQSPAWGEGRPEGERGPPRREFQPSEARPQYERQPTAADQDNQWRSKMRADAASPTGTPDASTPSSPAPLASRPKLNLAKRTVSEAPAAQPATPSDKPNPFGAARPIDTAAREREVEEKQKQAVQQKKEADDKAREEKKAKEAAAKEAASAKSTEEPKEGGEVPKAVENPEAEAEDETANGEIVDDKEVKPQEVVQAPKDGGSWRRKSSTSAAPAGTTTEAMEDDGWSTVTKAPKNARTNRRGGAPTRAIAS